MVGKYWPDDYLAFECYIFDISEEKNNEEKLRQQKIELAESNQQLTAYIKEIRAMNEELEQSFEELFEESEEGIVILDSDFDIIRANKYFLEMFEFETMDIIGKNYQQ